MVVKITPNDKGNPPGKLADAELHFTDGPLEGLKLIGFGIWERRSGGSRNVTFPARQYSVNGERRSFALLRPAVDSTAQDRIRDLSERGTRIARDVADEMGPSADGTPRYVLGSMGPGTKLPSIGHIRYEQLRDD